MAVKRPRRQLLDDQLGEQLGAEPMQSTGSGDFGAGARLPQPPQTSPYAAPTSLAPSSDPVDPAAPPASPRAAAAKAAAAGNYRDIEGAGNLATGQHMGALEGFNTGAWGTAERGSNTHKNTFGKIASRYDPTQAGAAKSVMADPDFRDYFPEATLVDHPNGDLIDFDGPGPEPAVDVLRAAEAGGAGKGWQWGVDAGGGGMPDMGGQGDIDGLIASLSGGMGGDPLAAIQAELSGLAGGADEQTIIQQILREQQMQR